MSKDVNGSPSDPELEVDPESPEGDAGSNKTKSEERPIENLRGELVRKYDRLADQVSALTEATEKIARAFVQSREQAQQRPDPPQQTSAVGNPYGAPVDMSQYSDQQLQQALSSGQLAPAMVRIVENTLAERAVERKTNSLFEQRDRKQRLETAREESIRAAEAAFPALREPNSEFSRRVKTALGKQREEFGEFPRDEFDVANRVAREMGVEVSRVITPGFTAKPDSHPEEKPSDEPEGTLDDDELKAIADRLRYAMPLRRNPKTGKMERKEFNLKRVKERSKRYAENSEFYNRGRKIGGKG